MDNLYYLEDIRKPYFLISYYKFFNQNSTIYYSNKYDEKYIKSIRHHFPEIKFEDISQFNYMKSVFSIVIDFTELSGKTLQHISKINHKKIIVLLNPNIGKHENIYKKLINVEYVSWNKTFTQYLIKARLSSLKSNDIKIVKYVKQIKYLGIPFFDNLIFLPTWMNFESYDSYFYFLKNLHKVLNNRPDEISYIKHHQATVGGYTKKSGLTKQIIFLLSFFISFKFLHNYNVVKSDLINKLFSLIFLEKLIRKFNLNELTEPNISAEFFFPYANTLIGGHSNTLIVASYFSKNIITLTDKIPDSILKNNKTFETKKYLKINMEFFKEIDSGKYVFNNKAFNEN